MRRKGLLLKLGFLGIGMLSASAMVVGTAANVGNNVSTVKAADSGDFYQISYAGGELKVLFAATPSSYAHLNATALANVKNALFTAVSNALSDKINIMTDAAAGSSTAAELTYLEWTPRYAYTPTTGMDADLIAKIIAASLSTGGVADIDKVDAFNNDSTGAYSTIVSYYADKYADAHPEYNRDEVYQDIVGVVQDKAQEMTTEAYTNAGYAAAEIPTAATTVVTAVNDTKATGVTIDLGDVTQMMSVVQDTMAEDSTITVGSFVSNLGQATVSQEIKDVLADAEANEIQEFMTQVQPTVIADTITAVDLSATEMKDVLDTIGLPKLLTVAQSIDVDGLKTILEAVPGYTSADLKEFIQNNASTLSISDIFNALQKVKVDGHVVLENGQFNRAGVKAVLADLPRPTEIQNWTDDQMHITWNVQFNTSLGDVDLPVTVGFFGNCDLIRLVAEYAGKAFDFSFEGGVIKLHVNAGTYLAKFARKVINSNLIPQSMLQEIFQFLTSDVAGMYEMINTKLLSDIIADLQGIDYASALGTVLSADFLNDTFNTSSLTDEKIDKVIDTFMKIFRIGNHITFSQFVNLIEKVKDLTPSQEDRLENLYNKFVTFLDKIAAKNIDSTMLRKLIDETDSSVTNQNVYNAIAKLSRFSDIYDRVQNLITKIYNKLPNSLKNRHIMGTYEGNGVWGYANTFNFDLLDVLTSLSSSYGPDIYNALTSVLGTMPTSVSVDLSFEAKDVYSITYDFGNGDTLVGALPSGVAVAPFALQDTVGGYDILKWVDASGNEVTMMPAADTTIYAVVDFEINNSADVTKVYDAADASISVAAFPMGSYTYQWKKDGAEVAGATAASLNVKDVADSGSYTCVVTRADGLAKESNAIAVSISAATIDVSAVAWDYVSPFAYDTNAKTVAIDATTLPAGVAVTYSGVTFATAAGEYSATATLTATDSNYVLVGQTTLTLNWKITQATLDVSDAEWDYTDAFTYDGTSHKVSIDPASLPDGVGILYVGTREATAAGTYTVTATLYSVDGSVALVGNTTLTLTWKINPVDVTVADAGWDYTDAFTYNGTEQGVGIDETLLPEHVEVVSLTGNKATNAGTYTATLVLGTDSANYTINGQETVEFTLTWVINKAQVDITGATWSADEFLYDGSSKKVTLNGLNDKVTVTYSGTQKATNAGQYVVNATIALVDADNYELVGTTTLVHDWVINQVELNVAGATWNYTAAFTYNGQTKTVSITSGSVDAGVVITYSGTRSARNAGSYTATATFSVPNANYKLVGTATTSISWKINQQEIDVSSVAWKYSGAFTYNGTIRMVGLDSTTLPDHVIVEYTGTVLAMNAGNYTATATLTAENENYKLVGTTTLNLNWVINVVTIDVSGVESDYVDAFTYDGNVHKVGVDSRTVPANVTATVSGQASAMNAGNYTAVITLTADSENYVLVGNTTITVSWKINAAQINVAGVAWNAANYTYNGKAKSVSLNENTIPANVTANYSGTYAATNAGTYQAIATLSADSLNYVLVGETTLKLNWEIKKATVSVVGAYWDSFETIEYDGKEHTVAIAADSIPAGVVVDYTGTTKATEVGNYTAIAEFSLSAAYAANYELVGSTLSKFEWSIVKTTGTFNYDSEEKDENGKLTGKVSVNMGIDGTLHIVLKDAESLKALNWKEVLGGKGASVYAYYEVYFADANGNKINVGTARNFKIELLLTEEAAARQAKYTVVSVGNDGSLKKIDSTREGDYMVFTTNLLGNFAIVEVGTTSTPWWILGLLIAAGAVIAVETYVIIVKAKKK